LSFSANSIDYDYSRNYNRLQLIAIRPTACPAAVYPYAGGNDAADPYSIFDPKQSPDFESWRWYVGANPDMTFSPTFNGV